MVALLEIAEPQRPRALIVTVYGLYAREEEDGWIGVRTLIRLLAELGVDEPAVRSSISRLKRRGVLEARRHAATAGYALTDAGRVILAEGDQRIFGRDRANLDDGWLLAVFSVPESERQHRHQLRSRLSWLGFGTVAAGIWIAPAHLEAETRQVLERGGLTAYVDLFHAEHLGFAELRRQVPTWWDLEQLQHMYDEFTATHAAVLTRWSRRRTTDDAQAFVDYVRALTAWRRLPFLDPGLPPDVLPVRWRGARAVEVFDGLRTLLTDPAHRHVEVVRAEP